RADGDIQSETRWETCNSLPSSFGGCAEHFISIERENVWQVWEICSFPKNRRALAPTNISPVCIERESGMCAGHLPRLLLRYRAKRARLWTGRPLDKSIM